MNHPIDIETYVRRMLGNERWMHICEVLGPDKEAFIRLCQPGTRERRIVEFALKWPDEFGDHLVECIPEDVVTDEAVSALHSWVENQDEAAWVRREEEGLS